MSMPALKPMIATIGKKLFHRLVHRFVTEFENKIDWSPDDTDEFATQAFAILSRNDPDTIAVRDKLYPHLFNIHTLSEKPKDGPYYYKCITNGPGDVKQKWFEEFSLYSPAIQTMAAWILLEAPTLFERLLTQALAQCREANGGYKFYLKGNYEITMKDPNGVFKEKLKSFLKLEYGVDMHVSIEKNEMRKYIRYIVTTDPFPSNGQHFSKDTADKGKDILKTHLKNEAECFYISFFRTSRYCYFQIKCDYNRQQRQTIADLFAEHVLSSRTGAKPEQNRNLNLFRKRPRKFDFSGIEGFVSLRYEGVNMRIASGGRKQDVYVRRFTNEDFYDAVERSGELRDISAEAKDIVELYVEITLKSGEKSPQETFAGFGEIDSRKDKPYLVTIKKHGFWFSKPTATESDERKIDQILDQMELRDITGDKILKTKVRK